MIMRTLCVALLLVPSSALKVANQEPTGKNPLQASAEAVQCGCNFPCWGTNDGSICFNQCCGAKELEKSQPKSASPEGIELLWQRPHGTPKGILLYLHGCHGRATSLWTTDGPDGFHFNVCNATRKGKCQGVTEEVLLRQKARKAGYVVAAVTGGVGSPRGCMNSNDVPRIQLAMKHLVEQETDLADKPVIMMGHSSGGRVLPELVATGYGVKNAKCIVPIADEIRIKGDSNAEPGVTPGYPEDVSAFFVHMENDFEREKNIKMNLYQMKTKGVRVGDLKLGFKREIKPSLFHAEGYGVSNETANRMFRALHTHKVIKADGELMRNPYEPGNWDWMNWRQAFEKARLIDQAGGYQNIQQFMDVGWNEHWMAGGRYLDKILDFCEQPGFERKSKASTPRFDLTAKVHELDGLIAQTQKEQNKNIATMKVQRKQAKEKEERQERMKKAVSWLR